MLRRLLDGRLRYFALLALFCEVRVLVARPLLFLPLNLFLFHLQYQPERLIAPPYQWIVNLSNPFKLARGNCRLRRWRGDQWSLPLLPVLSLETVLLGRIIHGDVLRS